VAWAPDELVLDTRSLRDVVRRAEPDAHDAASIDAVDAEMMERALQDAYERGVQDGRHAGEAAEASRLRHAVQAVTEALTSLHADADKWVGNAEENICALAIAIARQVIGREVASDKSSLSDMVRQALDEFPLDQPLTLRVNPGDLQAIHAAFHAAGELSPLAARKEVQWLPDPRIAAGGCLIEGRDRIVDGRVDTALERLYRRLTYTGA
jgi:flagellar biosynthesis/type III secretory pathway protein FliH